MPSSAVDVVRLAWLEIKRMWIDWKITLRRAEERALRERRCRLLEALSRADRYGD